MSSGSISQKTLSYIYRSKKPRKLWRWPAEGLESASDPFRKPTATSSFSHSDTEWEDVALTRVHVQEGKKELRKTFHCPLGRKKKAPRLLGCRGPIEHWSSPPYISSPGLSLGCSQVRARTRPLLSYSRFSGPCENCLAAGPASGAHIADKQLSRRVWELPILPQNGNFHALVLLCL